MPRSSRAGSARCGKVLVLLALLLGGCASAPLDYPRTPSFALTNTADTTLARQSRQWLRDGSHENGFYPLEQGLDAFGGRLTLIDLAERSIDAQYFLMKPDSAGLVFADNLLEAADRGVRVRFLLDDIFTTVDDDWLIMMNAHPNIEIRIFNPISRKGLFAFNYAGHFELANRRMHNKSFVVDNQAAIVGGRNIAEEYFQLDTSGEFIDFDMLLAGPIVRDVSSEFDRYWNHELAVPMHALYDEADPEAMRELRAGFDRQMAAERNSIYARAIHTNLLNRLNDYDIQPFLAEGRMIIDDPDKLLEAIGDEQKIVATEVRQALLAAEEEILVFTPYFIPGKDGIETVRQIAANGVRIIVVTNSLATNNHTPVHSAYSSYRRQLLDAGVELWEARADAAKIVNEDGTSELDHLTLHTKGILIDRRYTFVGSLNLDPRSIDINTEMGILIDSEPIATKLTLSSLEEIPAQAYRVEYADDGGLQWRATIDGREVVETREPQTSWWKRFEAWFMKLAPEGQL